MNNSCCFIGHRKISINENLEKKLYAIIEDLILNKNITTFLFGSKSEFDYLCYYIVSNLQNKYKNIERIAYLCNYESTCTKVEKIRLEQISQNITNQKLSFRDFEKTRKSNKVLKAGKWAYIQRNQDMINDSDFCIFYYNINYIPKEKKYSKSNQTYYQPKSGTKLSYDFALKQNKKVINVFE